MAGQLKDYYKILEVSPAATPQEIKASYRRLAFKYHPDTAQHSEYAEHYFKEIQEAWHTLSDAGRRKQYDEERWLSGMSNRARDKQVVTPPWILHEARRLANHMATVDTYRMSHNALHDYIFMLLSDSHMAILEQAKDMVVNRHIIKELLKATKSLEYRYMDPVAHRLARLAGSDNELHHAIYKHVRQRQRLATWDKYMPVLVTIITLFLVLMMYIWAGR